MRKGATTILTALGLMAVLQHCEMRKGATTLLTGGSSPAILELRNGKDTPLIDNIILKIERILHAVRRVFQKKCLFSYRDLRWFITRWAVIFDFLVYVVHTGKPMHQCGDDGFFGLLSFQSCDKPFMPTPDSLLLPSLPQIFDAVGQRVKRDIAVVGIRIFPEKYGGPVPV